MSNEIQHTINAFPSPVCEYIYTNPDPLTTRQISLQRRVTLLNTTTSAPPGTPQ